MNKLIEAAREFVATVDAGRARSVEPYKKFKEGLVELEDPKGTIDYPISGREYKHYKGGTYLVIGMGRHSESNELGVLYKSNEFGTHHFRPIKKWYEPLNNTGAHVNRFQLIKKDE